MSKIKGKDNDQRLIKQKRKGLPSVRSILLHRSGSGRGVISGGTPDKKWLKGIQELDGLQARYKANVCVVLAPEPISGYGGIPGCRIAILPGDHDGKLELGVREIKVRENDSLDFSYPYLGSGQFIISVSYNNLKLLHKEIGDTLRSMKRFEGRLRDH